MPSAPRSCASSDARMPWPSMDPSSRRRWSARLQSRPTTRCARSPLTHRTGRYHEALALARRPLAFLDDLDDPEQTLEIYEALVPVQTMLGMFDDARAISKLHTEATRRMTPHHRLHGAAVK